MDHQGSPWIRPLTVVVQSYPTPNRHPSSDKLWGGQKGRRPFPSTEQVNSLQDAWETESQQAAFKEIRLLGTLSWACLCRWHSMGLWAKRLTCRSFSYRAVFLGLRCSFNGNSIFIFLPFPMTRSHLSNAFRVLLTDVPAWSARRPCSSHWAEATGTWLDGGFPDTGTGLACCPRAAVWLSSSDPALFPGSPSNWLKILCQPSSHSALCFNPHAPSAPTKVDTITQPHSGARRQ